MYNVVFRNVSGAVTWTTFESEEKFISWYDERNKGLYEIVDQGVSRERAIELCSTPEANSVLLNIGMQKLKDLLQKIKSAVNEVDIGDE